jgi:hypothetical protein
VPFVKHRRRIPAGEAWLPNANAVDASATPEHFAYVSVVEASINKEQRVEQGSCLLSNASEVIDRLRGSLQWLGKEVGLVVPRRLGDLQEVTLGRPSRLEDPLRR